MTIGRGPACFECVHYRGSAGGNPRCDAFPDGIPDEIFYDGFDHRQPFPGDQGVRWEPREGITAYPDFSDPDPGEM